MEPITKPRDDARATAYIKSLRDAVKRRYAGEYFRWISAGRIGAPPPRGALSPDVWKAVCANMDALA